MKNSHINLVIILKNILSFFILFPSISCAIGYEKENIEAWLKNEILSTDKLLCKEEINGNYYFFAKSGKRYKAGARILLSKDSKSIPKKYIKSWKIRSQDKGSIITRDKGGGQSDKDEIIKLKNGYFENSIHYITLFLRDVDSFKVSHYLEKDSANNSSLVKICEIAVFFGNGVTLVNKESPNLKVSFPTPKYLKSVGYIYPEEDMSNFLKAVLDSMNLQYREEKTDRGWLVDWQYNEEYQVDEINNRVSQYRFVRDVCKGKKLPLPTQPALKKLQC